MTTHTGVIVPGSGISAKGEQLSGDSNGGLVIGVHQEGVMNAGVLAGDVSNALMDQHHSKLMTRVKNGCG